MPKKAITKKTPTRKRLMKQCDDLWSECVKYRDFGVSVRSGSYNHEPSEEEWKKLNSHHIVTRSNLATRWCLLNGLTLNAGEHIFWFHKYSVESTVWVQNYLGMEKFDKLMELSHSIVKWNVPQLQELIEQLKKERALLKQSYKEFWRTHGRES